MSENNNSISKDDIKQALYKFILRVSNGNGTDSEVSIMPNVLTILVEQF